MFLPQTENCNSLTLCSLQVSDRRGFISTVSHSSHLAVILYEQNTDSSQIKVVKQGGVGYHLSYVLQTPQKLVTLQKVDFTGFKV
jgi:hypothetical protein